MKRYVKTVGAGLLIGLLLVGVYELAGGDATIVVLLVLLAAHVKVRLDELRDTLKAMRAAEPTELCGNVTHDWIGDEHFTCIRQLHHADPWHEATNGVKWRRRP